ncbi:MAG TPA: hypothetical protein VNM16_13685 [Bacillota bacterium]|nr:hypothetical protein [Bacillota bacterium]
MVSPFAAARAGPTGSVWALDTRPEGLAFLRQQQQVATIHTVLLDDVASFDLPDTGTTCFVIADALHRTRSADAVVRRLGPVMPQGGRGVVSDYDPAVPRRLGAQTADRPPLATIR